AVTAVSGVGAVGDATELLPIASPYVWSARRAGQLVTLSGTVPSESMRNSVLANARRALPTAEIRDEMKLARGAATGFNAGTAFALSRLANLGDGTVTLTDAMLSVSGVAANRQAYGEAHTALKEEMPRPIAP